MRVSVNNQDKIGNSNAQVWLNTANAIKESGLDTVVISAVNYNPVDVATHGKGEALDILYVRQGGKDIRLDASKYASTGYPDYPDAVRAFDNAFIRQNGSSDIWNPWIMYYSGGTSDPNIAMEWIKSPHWPKIQEIIATGIDADLMKFFNDKAPELKPKGTVLPVYQDWGHTTHGHYNTNPTYSELRRF